MQRGQDYVKPQELSLLLVVENVAKQIGSRLARDKDLCVKTQDWSANVLIAIESQRQHHHRHDRNVAQSRLLAPQYDH